MWHPYLCFEIAVASKPYSPSIFWPSGDKIYIASCHASPGAPFADTEQALFSAGDWETPVTAS
jgi:hypothetical protein